MNIPVTMLELPPSLSLSWPVQIINKQTNKYQWPKFYIVSILPFPELPYGSNSAGILRTPVPPQKNNQSGIPTSGKSAEARFQETGTLTELQAWMPKGRRSPERVVLSSCLMTEQIEHCECFHLAGRNYTTQRRLGGI